MRGQTTINLYHDPAARTSIAELLPCLTRSFPRAAVRAVSTAAFLDSLDDAGSIAVLPGIAGEDCAYRTLLGDDGFARLGEFVAAGGLLMTFCAGSYHVAREVQYRPAWGAPRQADNARPLFNALAHGPVSSSSRQPRGSGRYDDTSVAQISYKSENGDWHRTGMAYGNGPALRLDGDDPTVETLAVYEDGPVNAIAAAARRIGRGEVLWFGVLPYMGYVPLDVAQVGKRVYDFVESLKACEAGRAAFWSSIVRRVDQHLERPNMPQNIETPVLQVPVPC